MLVNPTRRAAGALVSTDAATEARAILGHIAALAASTTVGPQNPLDHLCSITALRGLLGDAETRMIDAALREGASWSNISGATGRSAEGERRRWRARMAYEQLEPLDRWLHARVGRLPAPARAEFTAAVRRALDKSA